MLQRIFSEPRKWPFLLIPAINLTLCWATFVYASGPGDLDSTFNGAGIVTTTINGDEAVGTSVAIQPDGKIVVAGNLHRSTDSNFVLVRYENDGSLDTTFNTAGTVVAPIGYAIGGGSSVGLQSDGKIVVAGSDILGGGKYQFATVCYNPDGSLDTAFNNSGVVTTSIPSGSDFGYAVAIQPDDKILVAGRVNWDIGLVRYTITGTLDTTFNGSGVVTTSINDGGEGYAVALQTDEKILVTGVSIVGGDSDFAVIRYDSRGSLDTTFNSTGIVTTSVSGGEDDKGYYGIALQADDKIVVAGEGRDSGGAPVIVVARYNQNGSLDTSFNGTGIVTASIGSGAAAADVAVQPNGKIVVAGVGVTGGNSDLAVVRFNVDGSLDSSFGGTGIITTAINGSDVGRSVAIQPDGKIVVAGLTDDDGNKASIVAVRYIGEFVPCYLPIILKDDS